MLKHSDDEYLLVHIVSILEVLVHALPFWARLKQSAILQSLVVMMNDNERNSNSLLKKKLQAIIKAIKSENHDELSPPVDAQRYRPKDLKQDLGAFRDLPQTSTLVPVYQEEQPSYFNQGAALQKGSFDSADPNLTFMNQAMANPGLSTISNNFSVGHHNQDSMSIAGLNMRQEPQYRGVPQTMRNSQTVPP